MGSLLVVSGPPGAGKSTVAELLAADSDISPSAIVSGDLFFDMLRRGRIEPWRPEAHEQNVRVTRLQATTAAAYRDEGFHTIFDSVLGPWFLPAFVTHVGGPIDYAVLLPPLETCIERVRSRSDHPFRDEAGTRSLHAQFIESELDARHVIDSGASDAATVAALVRDRRSSGQLRAG